MPDSIPVPRANNYDSFEAANTAVTEFQNEFHALVVKYGLLGNIVGYAIGFDSPDGEQLMLVNSGCMGCDDVLQGNVRFVGGHGYQISRHT